MIQAYQTARAGEPVLQCLGAGSMPQPNSFPKEGRYSLGVTITLRGFTWRRSGRISVPSRHNPIPLRQRTGRGLLIPPQPGHKIQNRSDSAMSPGRFIPRLKPWAFSPLLRPPTLVTGRHAALFCRPARLPGSLPGVSCPTGLGRCVRTRFIKEHLSFVLYEEAGARCASNTGGLGFSE